MGTARRSLRTRTARRQPSAYKGVRVKGGTVQMGLTSVEIASVWRRCKELVEQLDDGKLKTF